MNTSYLHITNGDCTTKVLKDLNFKGEIITWREMLCEGKTTSDVGSESFWKNRFDFFSTSYKVTKRNFINLTLKEYRNLCNQKQQEEIILWFDHDLFCQINMIAVISWLKRYRKGRKIALICSGKIKGSKKLHSITGLNEKQVKEHYKKRVVLSQDDIEYADYIWQLYCSDSPLRLEAVYKFNPMSPFIYLADAMKAHLMRFPSIENGLNQVENNILNTANSQQLNSKDQLIDAVLKGQNNYGFGDLQYERKTAKLKNLFSSFSPVKLNATGKKIIENQVNYYAHLRSDYSYLGGVKKYSFLYHNKAEKLLKITS